MTTIPSVALFTPQPQPLIDQERLEHIKKVARSSELGRARLCLHPDHDDPIQEMIIVHTRRSLDRPHRHRHKSVSIMILEGVLRVPVFNDDGSVRRLIVLGERQGNRPFLTRLSHGECYACVPETDPVVLHETITGPFSKAEGFYPEWSPEEPTALTAFLKRAAWP